MEHVFYPSYLLASCKHILLSPGANIFGKMSVRTLQERGGESDADAIEKFAHKGMLLAMKMANAFHRFHCNSQIYASFKSTVLNTHILLSLQFRARATTVLRCAPS